MSQDDLQVKTYSGLGYAERPKSFVWQGEKYRIARVENSWLEPGERHFRVLTTAGKRFHLWYDEAMDSWRLTAAD